MLFYHLASRSRPSRPTSSAHTRVHWTRCDRVVRIVHVAHESEVDHYALLLAGSISPWTPKFNATMAWKRQGNLTMPLSISTLGDVGTWLKVALLLFSMMQLTGANTLENIGTTVWTRFSRKNQHWCGCYFAGFWRDYLPQIEPQTAVKFVLSSCHLSYLFWGDIVETLIIAWHFTCGRCGR